MTIPPVDTLRAFRRGIDKIDSDIIQYPNLEVVAAEARQKENAIWREFWEAKEGSVEEEDRARAAARGYLVLTALQLQQSAEWHRSSISERFTEAAIEQYDLPDETVVRNLVAMQYRQLSNLADHPGVDQNRLERMLSFFKNQLGTDLPEEEQPDEELNEALTKLAAAFKAHFGPALRVFENIHARSFTAKQAQALFNQAINILEQHDPQWGIINVAIADKSSMSFDAPSRTVEIGQHGSYSPGRLQMGFIEEVLVHAHRTMQASKTGDELLEMGLPGFGIAEEGIGELIKASMGKLSERSMDFYMDTSFALGQLEQPAISRPELVDIYLDRVIIRAQSRKQRVDMPKLQNSSWRYANRIYRGSLGNHHIAVNTKDIAYYHGYLKIGGYIKAKLTAGVSAEKLLDYLLFGRFDPTKNQHVTYLKERHSTALEG